VKADRIALGISCGFVLIVGAILATRAGYSPDEEITWFLVRGIHETQRPRLPSGLDYWRGPIFSYGAWMFGAVAGFTWPVLRMLSVLLSLFAVGFTFVIGRRISAAAGAAATVTLAIMPAFVAHIAYARFYAALIAASVAALAGLITRRSLAVFITAATIARLSHELGIAVVLFPLAAWLCGYPLHSSFQKRLNVALALGSLVVLHFALVSLQRTGIGGEAAVAEGAWLGMPLPTLDVWPIVQIAKWHDWLVAVAIAIGACAWLRRRVAPLDMVFIVMIAAAAVVFSIGIILVITLFWLMSASTRTARNLTIASVFALCSWLAWLLTITLRSDMLMSVKAALDLLMASMRASTGGIELFARELPGTSLLIALAAATSISGARTSANQIVRALLMLLLVYVVAFGIFGTDPRTRFIAVTAPLVAVLTAGAVCTMATRRSVMVAALALTITGIVLEQRQLVLAMMERQPTAIRSAWWAWYPTVGVEHPFDPQTPKLEPDELVVTNDELAALLILGRSDYWLAPDDFAARLYSRKISPTQFEGIYAGSRVIVSEVDLESLLRSQAKATTVVWFRSGKFGTVSPSFDDRSAWPTGSTFLSTPDWSMARVPSR